MKLSYKSYKKTLELMAEKKNALNEELVANYSDEFKKDLGEYIADLFHGNDRPSNSAVAAMVRALILGEFMFFFDRSDIEGLTVDDVKVIARYEITRAMGG